jgi:hypothetical protein
MPQISSSMRRRYAIRFMRFYFSTIPLVLKAASCPRNTRVSPALSLLASCRQVHAEASGVVYARNTFMIYSNFDTCDNDTTMALVDRWLSGIGRQRKLVHKVSVDISNIDVGTKTCTPSAGLFDLSPVLRQLFFHHKTNSTITFGQTSRKDLHGIVH